MKIGTTFIDDTFAEAFRMRYARLVVTAHDAHWLDAAAREFTGDSSSVIACDLESSVEQHLAPETTPDRRPGIALLAFAFSVDQLARAVARRTGQCLMTCPTTAVFDGLPDGPDRFALGKHLRFFGDGFQKSKMIDAVRYWRIPVMDGEFVVQETAGAAKGVAGGNLVLQARHLEPLLDASRRAVDAIARQEGVIAPFPGGVVRSGSKVGSKYKKLRASTADAFCPTLRGRVQSRLHPDANYACEIVVDGIDEQHVARAMVAAMRAAACDGVVAISAGNYGGKLGKFHFHLRELLADDA